MLSSNQTKSEVTEGRIQKIKNEIALEIKKLNSEIHSHPSDMESIGIWNQKITVLMATQACLLGGKADLEDIINENPCYRYKWNWRKGWYKSSSSNTQKIVDEVKSLFAAEKPLTLVKNTQSLSFESSGFDDPLSGLPNDIMLFLLSTYLTNIVNIINLAKTSTNRYRFYQQNQEQILLNSLLTHAVFGEWGAARKIWTIRPDILKLKGTVKRCYEYKNHTAYQIAWRNEEDDIIAEMNKILSPEEQKKQFDEIFPDGQLIKKNWSFDKAKQLLQAVFDAVIKDTDVREDDMSLMNDGTWEALQALHDHLNPDKSGQCQTGLVCDVGIYQQAFSCFDDKFHLFVDWNRLAFWCIRVEEMIATFLSTGYLRAHCQGIYGVVEIGRKVNDAGCILSNGLSYFRCTEDFLPGYHFLVNIHGCCGSRTNPDDHCDSTLAAELFGKFMSSKNIKLTRLKPAEQQALLANQERGSSGQALKVRK
jgi:hypothetical protein